MSYAKIDPIVPILPFMHNEDETASILFQLNKNFGFRRFLLCAPGHVVRLTGFPGNEVYRKFGEFLLAVKNRVADQDIQVGWWCAPSLKSGKATFQTITGLDGSISEISPCPLDEDFREVFARNIATVVEIAKPFIVQFEDDYNLSWHGTVKFGCFCPLHLKRFSQITGKEYSREDLAAIFSHVNQQSIELRKKWATMSCDTLTDLALHIRKRIDEVFPETRVSLCQSGCHGFEGEFTESVASAFGGKTKPMVRVHGTTHSSAEAGNIPQAIFNVHYSKENLPEHFELIHESDTYPHTRFFMSALKLKSLMAAAFSYGVDDSLFYTAQYRDDPLEESGYSNMFKAESKRFSTIKNELQDCHPEGCQICWSPWSHAANPYDPVTAPHPRDVRSPWVSVLGQLGIPYSVRPGKVKMLAGNYVAILSDDEIRKILSSGVMMDGKAAHILSQRGFGALIGAQISVGRQPTFVSERIEEGAGFKGIKGKLMYNFLFAPAGSEGGGFYEIAPQRNAKILTTLCGPSNKPVVPGMISFENSLGGQIVIMALDLENNMSSSIFNYRKKEIIRQTIEWLGREPLPVFVKDIPNVFCIYNCSDSGKKAIVTLINLCSDTAEQVELAISEKWEGYRLDSLNPQGKWIEVTKAIKKESVILPFELKLMEPVYLKIS